MTIAHVVMKSPDCLYYLQQNSDTALTTEELDWIRSYLVWDECMTVIFDTEKRTVTVKKNSEN